MVWLCARVGYAVSHPQIANVLNRIRQPFNTNLPAQHAAVASLQDNEYLRQSIEVNSIGMVQLEQGMQTLGLSWIPSAGNFITVDFGRDAMPGLSGVAKTRRYCATGCQLRDAQSFADFCRGCLMKIPAVWTLWQRF